jgi:hypothetical protein
LAHDNLSVQKTLNFLHAPIVGIEVQGRGEEEKEKGIPL